MRAVLSRITSAQEIINKNAELSARLQLAQRAEAKLKEENKKIKAHNQCLQAEVGRYSERVVLLEEELAQGAVLRALDSDERSVRGQPRSTDAVQRGGGAGGDRTLKRIGQETRKCYRFTPPKIV